MCVCVGGRGEARLESGLLYMYYVKRTATTAPTGVVDRHVRTPASIPHMACTMYPVQIPPRVSNR